MDRRYTNPSSIHQNNNPYITTANPYIHSGIPRYGKNQYGTTTRSSSSWVLWDPQPPPSHNICCTFLTLLILLLVILGVLAVAGLALYMGALRLEPTQTYLIFDGSMKVLADKYNNNLANKSSHFFIEKSRKYQTLLEAAYAKSLLGAALHELYITSFASGSLIVFFRIILDRRKIPKPIISIEEILKTVIIQEASSPLSIMNTLKIDPKDILIKRFIDESKYIPREEPYKNTTIPSNNENVTKMVIETKKKEKLERIHENTSEKMLISETNNDKTIVKNVPSQMIQGSYFVTTGDIVKTKKIDTVQEEGETTPSLVLAQNRRTTKGTTLKPNVKDVHTASVLLPNKHSAALNQFLKIRKDATAATTSSTTMKTTSSERTTEDTTAFPTLSSVHYSNEPWKPMIPGQRRDFDDKIDFDYGVGEAEVVLDNYSDLNITVAENITTLPRMKTRPVSEEQTVKHDASVNDDNTTAKPKIIFRSDIIGEQRHMPELSILKQFHDLDTLLRTQRTTEKPHRNENSKITTVVTLLPVRSNVAVRPTLRPRPKDDQHNDGITPKSTNIQADLSVMNPLNVVSTEETIATGAALNITDLNADSDIDMVAIPLQKYFATTNPVQRPNKHETSINNSDIGNNKFNNISAYLSDNLKEIAVVTTADQNSSTRQTNIHQSKENSAFNRKPKMPDIEMIADESIKLDRVIKRRPLDNEMKLLLEEIFHNLTTTARSTGSSNNVYPVEFNITTSSFYPVPSKTPFNLNTTHFLLNKLAKLQIANSDRMNNESGEDKVSNKAVATGFAGNSASFPMLTKKYNKVSESEHSKDQSQTQISQFDKPECIQSDRLLCGSGECIPAHLRCNKLWDCRDGTDETNCTCADFLKNQFHSRKICDGIFDCWDYSDEKDCDWCSPGQFVCGNSRMCIEPTQICDGFPHCPYGDDEKNCITLAPSVEMANGKNYHPAGYLIIRKEGEWGKMCMQNFDNVISKSKTDWNMEDLGQSVCKSLTYRNFDGIYKKKDENAGSVSAPPVYYELSYTGDKNDSYNYRRTSREIFSFQKTTCIENDVAHVACSDLECGIRPEATIPWGNERRSRIVGGGNAGPGSWPWQAALYKEGEFQCGATLISDSWLLSAGHCFYHAQDNYWVARLGALRRGTPPAPHEQLRPISLIVLHPEYEDVGFINDISLLRLLEPVILSSFVRPICLPQPNQILKDGTMCTVVGWGQLFEIGRVFPDTLQEVQLPIISTGECRKRTLFLPLYKVTDNMFCAGYERGGRDACLGDSGGPLMCQETDGRWTLTGVTSNGYGCARANRPGVYTKVVNYLDWVKKVMETNEEGHGLPQCHGHRCPLGECLPPARLCNGYIECRDSSDESGCT